MANEFKGPSLVKKVCDFFPEPHQTICSCMLTKSFSDTIAAAKDGDVFALLEAEREIGMERSVLERLGKREISDKEMRAEFLNNLGIEVKPPAVKAAPAKAVAKK
jgi:hypothetical protein